MGRIEIQSMALKAVPMGADFRLKLREFRELPSLEIMSKQLESFLPGGAVERLVKISEQLKREDALAGIRHDPKCTACKIIAELEALLGKG